MHDISGGYENYSNWDEFNIK